MTLQKTVAELPLETPVEDNGGEWNLLDISVIDRHSLRRQVCQVGIPARNANLFLPQFLLWPQEETGGTCWKAPLMR